MSSVCGVNIFCSRKYCVKALFLAKLFSSSFLELSHNGEAFGHITGIHSTGPRAGAEWNIDAALFPSRVVRIREWRYRKGT